MARNGDGGAPGGAAAAAVGNNVEDWGLQLGTTAMVWRGKMPSDAWTWGEGGRGGERKSAWEWGWGGGKDAGSGSTLQFVLPG